MPSKSRFGVQPLEHAEQLVGVLHVEAGAVVADEAISPSLAARGAHFDLRGSLCRVNLKALDSRLTSTWLQQCGRRCSGRSPRLATEPHGRTLPCGARPRPRRRSLRHADRDRRQRLTAETRQAQQVLDELAHVRRLAVIRVRSRRPPEASRRHSPRAGSSRSRRPRAAGRAGRARRNRRRLRAPGWRPPAARCARVLS